MIHPPKQDESQITSQGNPPRFKFKPKCFKFGTVALTVAGCGAVARHLGSRCDIEQPIDELQLAHDPRILVVNVATFDGSDRFDAAQCRLGRS